MQTLAMQQRNKIHPHKFTLWVAMGSILMMFAGLTSAYIIKKNQTGWVNFDLPGIFWYSTAVILVSSVTMYLAVKSIRARNMSRYRFLMNGTLVLGVAFVGMQFWGFRQLWLGGLQLNTTVSGSFLYVIVGLHGLHVIGGVIALLVMFFKSFSSKTKMYDPVPVEIIATYWHFVDFLWIYLLVFLLMIR